MNVCADVCVCVSVKVQHYQFLKTKTRIFPAEHNGKQFACSKIAENYDKGKRDNIAEDMGERESIESNESGIMKRGSDNDNAIT